MNFLKFSLIISLKGGKLRPAQELFWPSVKRNQGEELKKKVKFMMENKYKVLVNLCGGVNGGCPAFVIKGDKVQIIGTKMTQEQVEAMTANAATNVNVDNNEVAIEVDLAIFEAAVQEYNSNNATLR